MTHPAVSAILRSLANEDLVGSGPAGRGHTYWILRDNVYVEKVVDPVFSAERDIPDLMLDELRTELEPLAISVVLFGSYARGDQTTESDVDLVAVGEDRSAKTALEHQLATFSRRFEDRFGAALSPLVYDRREAADSARPLTVTLASIWDDAVTICGLSPDEWASDGST